MATLVAAGYSREAVELARDSGSHADRLWLVKEGAAQPDHFVKDSMGANDVINGLDIHLIYLYLSCIIILINF